MNGRVLSEEELRTRIHQSHMDFDQLVSWIVDLENTIRDRDKTIAELQDSTHYAIGRAVHRLQQQNTILREALEEIAGYQIGEKGTCDINLYYCVTDAREALAKVNATT